MVLRIRHNFLIYVNLFIFQVSKILLQLIELEAAGWTLPAQVVVVQLYTLLQLIELQAAGWTLPAQVVFVQFVQLV